MAKLRTLTVGFFLTVGTIFSLPHPANAAACDAFVSKWAWFIGGEVTVNPDGTFVQQSGNAGTWECTDPARGRITMRWRDGGFVNSLVVSPDGQNITSTDLSQSYVTARRSSPGSIPQVVRQENCCQEAFGCETKKIEAEFEQKMAKCHFPGNSGCIAEATSTKASRLKAANERLRSCNRAANSGVSSPAPATGGAPPPPPVSNDEFHSTDGTGGFAKECQPCGFGTDQTTGGVGDTFGSNEKPTPGTQPTPKPGPPWGKGVKVDGTPEFQKKIGDCFRGYQRSARQSAELAVVMREVLERLSQEGRTVTIFELPLKDGGDNHTIPVKSRGAQEGPGSDAAIHLDSAAIDQYASNLQKFFGQPVADDVCGVLIHELDHAIRLMNGTMTNAKCQLEGGVLEEYEVSAMALENAYRILRNQEPIWGYVKYEGPFGLIPKPVRLPKEAIRPTLKDFEIGNAGGWCDPVGWPSLLK